MNTLATLLWGATTWASVEHINGNPTAINGIIGAGLLAAVVTVLAWLERP